MWFVADELVADELLHTSCCSTTIRHMAYLNQIAAVCYIKEFGTFGAFDMMNFMESISYAKKVFFINITQPTNFSHFIGWMDIIKL